MDTTEHAEHAAPVSAKTGTDTRPYEAIPEVVLPEDYMMRTGPFLVEMYQQHGPIFRAKTFYDSNMDIVFLVGPEANRFVLQSDRLKFSHKDGWGHFFSVIEIATTAVIVWYAWKWTAVAPARAAQPRSGIAAVGK